MASMNGRRVGCVTLARESKEERMTTSQNDLYVELADAAVLLLVVVCLLRL